MKRFAFPEIWVQKQRPHPSLARAQCASLCHGFRQSTIMPLSHAPPPLSPPPHPPVPLRAVILPQQGQPIRTLDSHSREAACEAQGTLAAQWEPTWSGRPDAILSAERIRYPHCGPWVRGQSKEPQTCQAALR